ncbi:MAG: DNA primase [Deltaproteobacteria bacterium]|nr:MAG: DNA primase [Deltaproteobacteria bacterium]
MLIPEDILQTIRERVSVVEVVSQHVALKRAGSAWKGLCPFHTEKTPSFTVNEDRGTFKCFGCGKGGNIFTFLMEVEGRSFRDAAEHLAEKAGVVIPAGGDEAEERAKRQEVEAVREILELSARYFRYQFIEGRAGERAREYSASRGLTEETLATFNVGCAPEGWDNLARYLANKKLSLELGERAGLLVPRKNGGYYDRFRDRLIFPITDTSGRTVSFGGRVLGDGEPKYLNGPESVVFHKGRVLYGLFQGGEEIRRSNRAILVEGYMDVVMLHQLGIRGAVASLGTALTREHVEVLRRRVGDAVLVYDGDNAGRKAMERSLEIFLAEGFPARAVLLPDGEDPDTFVASGGDLETLVQSAPPLFDVTLGFISGRHNVEAVEGRIEAVNETLPLLRAVTDGLSRDLYIKHAAELLRVDENLLRTKAAAKGGVATTEEVASRDSLDPLQLALLRVLVHDLAARKAFREKGGETLLDNSLIREASIFAASRSESASLFPLELAEPRLREILSSAVMDDSPGDYATIAGSLEVRYLRKLSDDLQAKVNEAIRSGEGELFKTLAKEKVAIDRKISQRLKHKLGKEK